MPNNTIEKVSDSAAVLAAIEHAHKLAGKSDKEFVRAYIKGKTPLRKLTEKGIKLAKPL